MKKPTFLGGLGVSLWILAFAIGAGAQPPKSAHKPGIAWHQDLKAAFKQAVKLDKPLMIEFMAEWCPSCKMMEDSTFVAPGVIEKTDRFIPVRIDVDKQKDVADHYKSSAMKYGGIGIPNILFMTPDGARLKHRIGYMDAVVLTAVMDSVLAETK
jgi:thiol:disulfide interchange protein